MDRSSKKARRLNRLILIAFFVTATVFVLAVVLLAVTLIRYRTEDARYDAAAEAYVATPAPTVAAMETPDATPVDFSGGAVAALTQKPQETPPVTVDFDALIQKSADVVAWLYAPDTKINYPVVLGADNSYYLTHTYTGEESAGGALFFDARTDTALEADNLIIYGHHMKDRTMFGSLKRYADRSYYDAHPILYLMTAGGQNYRIEVFAACARNSDADQYPVYFQTAAMRSRYIRAAGEDSKLGLTVKEREERLISLVTCSYSGGEYDKFVVYGWLVPID